MTLKALLRLLLLLIMLASRNCVAQHVTGDVIVGLWTNVENTLTIDVYKSGNDFKARIVWFRDHDNRKVPMEDRKDVHNPDKKLRDRKIIGMELVRNLEYNEKDRKWEKGIIYDATSGREWSSAARITENNLLRVRGFWKFEWIGKTIVFRRGPVCPG